ncbi:MAG: LysR family transcriptional regulator [Lachnospiraceae bacterium]|nr:LysR family transcriptional regulator [Lachnospiraceae bacterium]
MKPYIRVYLDDDENNAFFGDGPCRLLHAIEECGSLRGAAVSMGMAYTKALSILKKAEQVLNFSLTEKTIGGKGGGGSHLTTEAKEFLEKYEAYRDACLTANQQLYLEIFSK